VGLAPVALLGASTAAANPTHTYTEDGVYRASLRVTDRTGRSASADIRIVVGNEVPQVSFVTPTDGQEFQFGDTISYEVTATDDQPFDCAAVTVDYILGHDSHGHPQTTSTGCTGRITTGPVEGHDPGSDHLVGVFHASYTDPGTNGLPGLTGDTEVHLTPTE
jgi:cytochrome c